jgi:hypothetical protein
MHMRHPNDLNSHAAVLLSLMNLEGQTKHKQEETLEEKGGERDQQGTAISLFSTLCALCVPLCMPFSIQSVLPSSSQTLSPLHLLFLPSLSRPSPLSPPNRTAGPPPLPRRRRFTGDSAPIRALSVVPRRIGGDRSPGLEVSQGPFPIANSCSACALPGVWGAGSSARARRLRSRRCGFGTTNRLTCSGAGFACADSMISCCHHEHTYEMGRLQKGASTMC